VLEAVDVTCGLSLGEYTALAFAGEAFAGLVMLV
jgi:malonyl CoA-acyl carrier protein transacylase